MRLGSGSTSPWRRVSSRILPSRWAGGEKPRSWLLQTPSSAQGEKHGTRHWIMRMNLIEYAKEARPERPHGPYSGPPSRRGCTSPGRRSALLPPRG